VKTIEVSVEANGVLKLPAGVSLPARTRLQTPVTVLTFYF
jgi:hypothetical protein